jgi:ABC-type branched-subunit amino acid transport system substrate-binding protein
VRRAALLGCLVLVLAGCEGESIPPFPRRSPHGRPADSDSFVIGLVGTLSGPDSWRGEDAFEGADLAVHELNEAPRDVPFELITLDDRGDAGRSLELVTGLTRLDNTVGIVFAGPPAVLPRAEPALAASGIPALLLYGDLYSARALAPHLFQMPPAYLWEARRIAAYLEDDRGYGRIGIVVEATAGGQTAARTLRRALGGRTWIERYDPEDPAFESGIRRLRRKRTEAVVIHGGPRGFSELIDELSDSGASYVSTRVARAGGRRKRPWRPQVAGLDAVVSPLVTASVPAGTVAAGTLARGAHYLPVPSFERFRIAFADWWDVPDPPIGWQQSAYDAVRMVGWAANRARPGTDIAHALEGMRARRFGGLDITLGPDDHTAVSQTAVGLWVVPRPGVDVLEQDELPDSLPWVPLARGFSIDGEDLDIAPADWRYLVRNPPPESGPPPRFSRLKFGVTTGRSDPVH